MPKAACKRPREEDSPVRQVEDARDPAGDGEELSVVGVFRAAPKREPGGSQAACKGRGDSRLRAADGSVPLPVSALEAVGLSSELVRVLRDAAGLHTVQAAAAASRRVLMRVTGCSAADARLVAEACERVVPFRFFTAAELHAREDTAVRITTGCRALDRALGGGVRCGSVTVVYGESGTGKTQLCHTLAVACQMPVGEGGAGCSAMYVGTRPVYGSRLLSAARRFGVPREAVMEDVTCVRPSTTDMLLAAVRHFRADAADGRYGLIVVDSATALYRYEYDGREDLAPRQRALSALLRVASALAADTGLAVVLTSEAVSRVDGTVALGADPVDAVGGNVLGHAADVRLYLRRAPNRKRICRVSHSPELAETEVVFAVLAGGVSDPDP